MSWLSRLWLGRVRGHKSSRPRPRQTLRSRPVLEHLEDRRLLSCSLVTNRAALLANDYLDWGDVGPENDYISNPFGIQTRNYHKNVGVWKPGPESFGELIEGSLWHGNFNLGDRLLGTYDSYTDTENPIYFGFGPAHGYADGLYSGAGAQIQTWWYGNFTASIKAYDFAGHLLPGCSFTEPGLSTSLENGSAIFIGISSTTTDINKVAISIVQAEGPLGFFAINQFDIQTYPPPPIPPFEGVLPGDTMTGPGHSLSGVPELAPALIVTPATPRQAAVEPLQDNGPENGGLKESSVRAAGMALVHHAIDDLFAEQTGGLESGPWGLGLA